jgi:hypothetical protein
MKQNFSLLRSQIIGKKYQSKQTEDTGTVIDVRLPPRGKVFLNDRQYRKELHVLIDIPGIPAAASTGYPVALFLQNFKKI